MKKTGAHKACENCGTSFYVPGWQLARGAGQFCSMVCMWEGRKRRPRQRNYIDVFCEGCGKTFPVIPSRKDSARFCSTVCSGRAGIAERQRRNVEAIKASDPSLRECRKCLQEKHLSEFEKRKGPGDGYRFECRACRKPKRQAWLAENGDRKRAFDLNRYYENRDEIRADAAKKYAENREAIRAERKQWAKDNPDKVRKWARAQYLKHGDKRRALRREHYRKNKPIYVANARKREERVRQATPAWADLKAIEAFYVRAAELTLRTGIKHHVDHIYPLKSKVMCGLHVETNLQIVPAKVNLLKSNRIEDATGVPLCCAWPSVLHFESHMGV